MFAAFELLSTSWASEQTPNHFSKMDEPVPAASIPDGDVGPVGWLYSSIGYGRYRARWLQDLAMECRHHDG